MANRKKNIFVKSTNSLQTVTNLSINKCTDKLREIDNFILDNWSTRSKTVANCKKDKNSRKIFEMIQESNKENAEFENNNIDQSFPEAKFEEKDDSFSDKKNNFSDNRIMLENKTLQDENFKLISELNKKRDECIENEKKKQDFNEKLEEMRNQIDFLKNDNIRLKEEIVKCKENVCLMKEEKVAVREQNLKLAKKMEDLAPVKEKYDKIKHEFSALAKENEKNKAEKNKTLEKFTEMNKKMMILLQQNEKLSGLLHKTKIKESLNSFQNDSFVDDKKNISNPLRTRESVESSKFSNFSIPKQDFTSKMSVENRNFPNVKIEESQFTNNVSNLNPVHPVFTEISNDIMQEKSKDPKPLKTFSKNPAKMYKQIARDLPVKDETSEPTVYNAPVTYDNNYPTYNPNYNFTAAYSFENSKMQNA